MSPEQLLALAEQGTQSLDARTVLADAIEESGWWDSRIRYALSDGPMKDREEFLALLTWPGAMGERHAQVVVDALRSANAKKEGT